MQSFGQTSRKRYWVKNITPQKAYVPFTLCFWNDNTLEDEGQTGGCQQLGMSQGQKDNRCGLEKWKGTSCGDTALLGSWRGEPTHLMTMGEAKETHRHNCAQVKRERSVTSGTSISCLWHRRAVLPILILKGNWLQDTRDHSVLFLITNLGIYIRLKVSTKK